ncbi:MAG: hypothetical protein ACOY94_12835 [Bacillota bacterium]
MTAVMWPTWIAWLLAIAILITLFFVWTLTGQVTALRGAMRSAGVGGNTSPRTRKELEAAYTAGAINRDAYERLKGRLP